ncbi:MAG TPA: glycosyltransferase family 2 protein [Methanomassiliicoccales archaeon]|nr:glycosyltransferase family 2 protein [Methanomassiliicoccales archaeon]
MGEEISVIIPTKGRAESLPGVLASLHSQSRQVYEVILVDDSTEDGFQMNRRMVDDFIRSSSPSFRVEHILGRHIGLTDARNQGFDSSRGDIISYLDDDVVLEADYYQRLAEVMDDQEVAGVTGTITNYVPQSRRWSLFARLFFLTTAFPSGGYLRLSAYPCFTFDSPKAKDVEVMSGCNMNFRREVLVKHRFDPSLRGYSYMEDSDQSFRASREFRLVFEPKCRLRHETADRGVDAKFYKVKMSYHRYVFRKNFSPNPLNLLAFGISVLGDLMLVTMRSIGERDRSLVAGALAGLSRDAMPSDHIDRNSLS